MVLVLNLASVCCCTLEPLDPPTEKNKTKITRKRKKFHAHSKSLFAWKGNIKQALSDNWNTRIAQPTREKGGDGVACKFDSCIPVFWSVGWVVVSIWRVAVWCKSKRQPFPTYVTQTAGRTARVVSWDCCLWSSVLTHGQPIQTSPTEVMWCGVEGLWALRRKKYFQRASDDVPCVPQMSVALKSLPWHDEIDETSIGSRKSICLHDQSDRYLLWYEIQ